MIPLAIVPIAAGRAVTGCGFSRGILAFRGANLGPSAGFRDRRVEVTFWSRIRSGKRSELRGAVVAAAEDAVVVIRVVRSPDAVVVVVKIPADGFLFNVVFEKFVAEADAGAEWREGGTSAAVSEAARLNEGIFLSRMATQKMSINSSSVPLQLDWPNPDFGLGRYDWPALPSPGNRNSTSGNRYKPTVS